MPNSPKRRRAPLLERVSSQSLIRLLIASVSVLVISASVTFLMIARAQDNALLKETEQRLLLVLENRGLSGLSVAAASYDKTLLPPRETVEFAVWRRVGDDLFLLAETLDGMADAMLGGDADRTELTGTSYVLGWPDVAVISRNWEANYNDVVLGIALRTPSTQMQSALLIIAILCGMGAVFLLGMVLVNLNHQRRYAQGLAAINQTLDRFAHGQTDLRVNQDPVAPEIDRLAVLLNHALSRIDVLTNGLRYMSGHLAHELNTPQQKIRVITSRIADQPDLEQRERSVAEIDRILETAGARQKTLMQLFRLEAGENTNLSDQFDLGALVEEIYEDFEDVLNSGTRQVTLTLAQRVEIRGNRPLFELLVTNLLTNAGKYAVPTSHIRITLTQDQGGFCLTVSNDGSVFPEAVRAGSFRRFVRADDGDGPPGAGLGLNLIFAICQAHGFDVSLPRDPDKAIIVITGKTLSQMGTVT